MKVAQKRRARLYERKREEKREKRGKKREGRRKPCEAKVEQMEVIFLLLQAFQELYKW